MNAASHSAAPEKNDRQQRRLWFGLALAMSAAFGMLSLSFAFSKKYVVQDDARHYVLWMQRFTDPALLPNDLIADSRGGYPEGAPPGVNALYFLAAKAGVTPLVFSKLLPTALALVATGFCFALFLRLLPSPPGAFFAAFFLNQVIWLNDDVSSATSRAFIYPLFPAFLFCLTKRSLVWVGVTVALLGLFCPQSALLAMAVLSIRCLRWAGARPCGALSRDKKDYQLWLVGLLAAGLTLAHYQFNPSPYGPTITLAQARLEPAFNYVGNGTGRTMLFYDNKFYYWLFAENTGLLALHTVPVVFACALLLPFWLRRKERFPLAREVSPELRLLNQVVLAAIGMFVLAHLSLFALHLPSRYTGHSFRIVLALAAGLALALAWDAVRRSDAGSASPPRCLIWLLVLALLIVPIYQRPTLAHQNFIVGQNPAIYEFLARQPKDALTASLLLEADNLPIFAHRSVLVAHEYAYPFQTEYYAEIRQRCLDLIEAQYSPDLETLRNFIRKYRVAYFLTSEESFTPEYVAKVPWFRQFQPATATAITNLQQGVIPALAKLSTRATVVEAQGLRLLDARLILQPEPGK